MRNELLGKLTWINSSITKNNHRPLSEIDNLVVDIQKLEMMDTYRSDTRATLGGPTKNISPTYSLEIHGWDFSWLELLFARLPPFLPVAPVAHSSSSSQLKSQPCISREYVGCRADVIGELKLLGFLVWPLYELN